jgi:3-deoxy-D-manno-octulosonate 8-phosphate phosphatase (KDO 8-P phosphatase)
MTDIAGRAACVRLLAFDVDGVCTDGRLYYGPDGCALHAFHARDGLGLVLARENGLVCAAISGRTSKNVSARLGELRVPHVRQGIARKDVELRALAAEVGVGLEEVCFVGDDVNDLPALRLAGLAAAVADAEQDVIAVAHVVLRRAGGAGALRELVEIILRAQGRWTA